MIHADLPAAISSDLDLICCADLADISNNPYYLHRLLTRHFKDAYSNKERFVFFSGEVPTQPLLEYIKKTCDACNISPSYVLIACPHDLGASIEQVCGVDDKFDHVLADVSGKTMSNTFGHADTICPLPWMHLAINSQGIISPCCVNSLKIGTVHDQDPKNVFEGAPLQELRHTLQHGTQHESCMSCWKVENNGGTSVRQQMLKWHHSDFFGRLIDAPSLESIDVKAGNTCNFKCRSCNASSSSSIAAETLRYATNIEDIKSIKLVQQLGKWFDQDLHTSGSKILSLFDKANQIDFYGGEPFLVRGFEPTIDYLIRQDRAPYTRIHVNTNCSIFPKHDLLQKLQQFHLVDIGLSIDDVGKRFEIIRGGCWDQIAANIERYRNLVNEQFQIHIYITVSVLNVYYLDQVMQFCDNLGIPALLNFVNEPKYLSIDQLTLAAKNLFLDKYLSHPNPLFQPVVNRIQNSAGSDGRQFVQETRRLDSIRSQNFSETHTEIAHAMGYV